MEIRKLTRNDFLRARVLLNNVLGGLENPNFLQDIKDENLENMLLSGTMFGAFKKGELVGISALELDECPYEIRYKSESERLFIGEIMFMVVKIENRGKGIINKINNVLIEQAKNLGLGCFAFVCIRKIWLQLRL